MCLQGVNVYLRDEVVLNDSSKQLSSDLQLFLGKLGEELVLFKHVP